MRRVLAGVVMVAAGACASQRAGPSPSRSSPTTTMTTITTTTSPSPTTISTSVAAPGTPLTPADVPASWRAGCPVPPSQLRRVAVQYWGFDDQAHSGAVVVTATIVDAVSRVFARLYEARFPIRHVEPIDAYGGDDEKSLDADNTAGFNCRNVVGAGPARWSVHAYGEAIDVNPLENPYLEGGVVHPAAGKDYVNRSPYRPGMAVSGGELVRAFASVGWQWGGRWSASPDYQHFSATGG
jgi:D-alanyl-D-alanine carboxypeptidase-like protein